MKPRASWTLRVNLYPHRHLKPAEARRYARRSIELLENLGYTAELVGEVEVKDKPGRKALVTVEANP